MMMSYDKYSTPYCMVQRTWRSGIGKSQICRIWDLQISDFRKRWTGIWGLQISDSTDLNFKEKVNRDLSLKKIWDLQTSDPCSRLISQNLPLLLTRSLGYVYTSIRTADTQNTKYTHMHAVHWCRGQRVVPHTPVVKSDGYFTAIVNNDKKDRTLNRIPSSRSFYLESGHTWECFQLSCWLLVPCMTHGTKTMQT